RLSPSDKSWVTTLPRRGITTWHGSVTTRRSGNSQGGVNAFKGPTISGQPTLLARKQAVNEIIGNQSRKLLEQFYGSSLDLVTFGHQMCKHLRWKSNRVTSPRHPPLQLSSNVSKSHRCSVACSRPCSPLRAVC